MRHGGQNTKYVGPRVKSVAFGAEKTEEPGEPKWGTFAFARGLRTGLMRKDAAHV